MTRPSALAAADMPLLAVNAGTGRLPETAVTKLHAAYWTAAGPAALSAGLDSSIGRQSKHADRSISAVDQDQI